MLQTCERERTYLARTCTVSRKSVVYAEKSYLEIKMTTKGTNEVARRTKTRETDQRINIRERWLERHGKEKMFGEQVARNSKEVERREPRRKGRATLEVEFP